MKNLFFLGWLILGGPLYGGVTSFTTPPAGNNGEVQYNCRNSFCADSDMTFSSTTNRMSLDSLLVSSIVFRSNGSTQTAVSVGDMVLASTQTSTGAKTFNSYTIFNGTVTINSSLGVSSGSVSAPGFYFIEDSDHDTGLTLNTEDQGFLVSNSTAAFIWKSYSNQNSVFGSPKHLEDLVGTKYVSNFRYGDDTDKVYMRSLIVTENADTADVAMQRFDGTYASPVRLATGTWTGALYWSPYDGTDFQPTTLYGCSYTTDVRSGPVATNGTTGPFNFTGLASTIGGDSDIAVFVIPTGTKNMYPTYLKTKTVDYSYTFFSSSLTLTLASAIGAGSDIWVFRRNNCANNNPFYGRQGDIRVKALEVPTQYGRGGVMVFSVTKSSEVAQRPRMWINGDTGSTIIGGKAVYEANDAYNWYPDRFDQDIRSIGLENGAPSGINPMNSTGTAALTILASSDTIDGVLAMRNWNSQTNGFDFDMNLTSQTLGLKYVTSSAKTRMMTFSNAGNVSIGTFIPTSRLDVWDGNITFSDVDVLHGLTSVAPTNAYGQASPVSGTAGGLDLKGISDSDAAAFVITGIVGATSITATPLSLVGAKSNGGTSSTSVSNTETVMNVKNSGTTLITVLGSGNTGFGDTTPSEKIEIEDQTNGACEAIFGGNSRYFICASSVTNVLGIGGNGATHPAITLFPMHITAGGVLKSTGTAPYHTFASVNSTPTFNANEASIWAIGSPGATAEMKVIDGAGNITTISPHNAAGEWVYYSVNVNTGRIMQVNMEKMIRKLEQITGESFIEETIDGNIPVNFKKEVLRREDAERQAMESFRQTERKRKGANNVK